MNTRLLVTAVAATLLLTAPAFAQTSDTSGTTSSSTKKAGTHKKGTHKKKGTKKSGTSTTSGTPAN